MTIKMNLKDAQTNSIVKYINHDQGVITGSSITIDANSNISGANSIIMPAGGEGTNNFTIVPSASQAADITFTLPATTGSNGQYLQGDGNGNMSFANAVSNLTANAGSAAIVVNTSGTAANITLSIDANVELKGLSTLATTGLVSRVANSTYSTMNIIGNSNTNNVVVSSVGSNIVVDLNSAVTIASLTASVISIASATAPSSPVIGQMYYDSTINALKIYAMNSVTSSAAWATLVLQF